MNKLTLVKIGGNLINHADQLDTFLTDFALLPEPKILVHGGGNKASALSHQLGIKPQLVDGRRITSSADLDIVTMVYAGLINKQIVALLQAKGCNAMGLSGADANLITSVKRREQAINYGFVGDVKEVNTESIQHLLHRGISPVFCAITHDGAGQLLNTNADTVAAEIAVAMSHYYELSLIYCFEKKGVLKAVDNPDSVIEQINKKDFQQLKSDKIIADGMLPKMDNCFYALEKGVKKVIIGGAQVIGNQSSQHTEISLK